MKQGWEIKKLGEVCKIQTGKLDANAKEDDGMYPFFTCDAKPYRINTFAFDDEAILISGNGSLVGHVNYYNGKFNAYQRTYVLTKFTSYHLPFLISYLKGFLRSYIIENKKGGCIPYITLPILQNFTIPCPPIAEQEKIVAELDCLSGIIEKKKQQLKELDNLAQSIFYEMFGDPVENDKGWEVKKLGEVCDIINGFAFKSPLFVKEGDLILRISNIQDGYVDIEDIAHFNKVDYPKVDFERYAVHPNDIVVALSGATTGKLGINKTGKKLYLNQRVAICREKDEVLHRTYLLYYLMRQSASFLETAAGVAQPNLSTEQMKNYTMGIPPKNIQQHFAFKIESIEKQKELIAQSIKETETLFNSRMDYYFN